MKKEVCTAKPKIDYPCPWLFKVIGVGSREVEEAIRETLEESCSFTISASMASSGGKYHSVNLEMEVVSEEHRNSVYRELSAHVSVKVVL